MRVSRVATFMALSVTLTVAAVAAAQASPIAAGTFEFSPSLAFNRSSFTPAGGGDAGTITQLNLNAGVSRAMSEQFQLTAGALLQHKDIAGNGRTSAGLSAGGQFNFKSQQNVIPFMSASLGVVQYQDQGSADRALLAPMIRVGFRSMVADARSLNVSLGYQHETNSKSAFESTANLFDVGVGMSLFRAPR